VGELEVWNEAATFADSHPTSSKGTNGEGEQKVGEAAKNRNLRGNEVERGSVKRNTEGP